MTVTVDTSASTDARDERRGGPLVVADPASAAGLGTILGVWAHPDDEAYLAAGLMALAVEAGNRVVCVTATRGERGTDDPSRWPPRRLARRRMQEMASAMAVLGIADHYWLPYRDGRCADADPACAAARVRAVVDDVRPDTVVTFGFDGMTGHPDHRAVSRWVDLATAGLDLTVLHATTTASWAANHAALHARLRLFGPDGPPVTAEEDLAVAVDLPADVIERKLAALRAHASQTAPLRRAVGEPTYRAWWAREWFVAAPASTSAEARHRAASRG